MSVACVGCFALHSIMIYAIAQRITVAAIAVVSVGGMPIAWAQDASGWDGELHAAARLIGGAAPSTKLLRAGLEIRLDPGWKTYWRYPGDSGVPPTFDFAGSQNVRSVTTLWPAPKRFADGAGGQSVGYFGDVVLPLTIVPEDASKPASLRVKLGYAICANLCVPAEADLDLTLSGRPGAEEPALVAAEARVPRRIPLGATDERGGLAVRSVHREAGGAQPRVVVEIAAPVSVFDLVALETLDAIVEDAGDAAGLGVAAARTGRRRAGNATLYLRPRWAATRRTRRRRDSDIDRRLAQRRHRGGSPSRLILQVR